jgi:hypothetical protein
MLPFINTRSRLRCPNGSPIGVQLSSMHIDLLEAIPGAQGSTLQDDIVACRCPSFPFPPPRLPLLSRFCAPPRAHALPSSTRHGLAWSIFHDLSACLTEKQPCHDHFSSHGSIAEASPTRRASIQVDSEIQRSGFGSLTRGRENLR